MLKPIIVIVGRPNVGKSTLFNRLLGARRAITDDRPGVTRDCLYAEAEWNGRRFTLVDTGGYVPHSKDAIEAAIRVQVEQAMAEADVILLLCEAASGVTDMDRQVAELLRRRQGDCLLVVNKVDNPERPSALEEFYGLGLGEPLPVSAATGRRSGDLLDALVQALGERQGASEAEEELIRLTLTGRPNVGKSTLINRLADHQVSIVDARPGTTRDTTSIRLEWGGRDFLLMDTAGLRQRARVDDPLEYYSGRRAAGAIERADVAIVLLDAAEGMTFQDARIMDQVMAAGRGLVVVANKWDRAEAEGKKAGEFSLACRTRFPFLADYPLLFISGLTGARAWTCMEEAVRVWENRRLRVSTSRLNRFLEPVWTHSPPSGAGREIRLFYAVQQGMAPPTFAIFADRPELVPETYRRFLEKNLRQEFGFAGTPLRILFRSRRGEAN